MATDYDAPRRGDVDEMGEDSLEELKARRAEAQSGSIDVDETELNESLELPGADLSSMSGEELTVRVLPKQSDEFTCSSCFLVHHRSRLARERNGQLICRDCAVRYRPLRRPPPPSRTRVWPVIHDASELRQERGGGADVLRLAEAAQRVAGGGARLVRLVQRGGEAGLDHRRGDRVHPHLGCQLERQAAWSARSARTCSRRTRRCRAPGESPATDAMFTIAASGCAPSPAASAARVHSRARQDVDVHDLARGALVEFGERAVRRVDAGVVHQHVQAPEAVRRRCAMASSWWSASSARPATDTRALARACPAPRPAPRACAR